MAAIRLEPRRLDEDPGFLAAGSPHLRGQRRAGMPPLPRSGELDEP